MSVGKKNSNHVFVNECIKINHVNSENNDF
jgi:hypothetical protein